MKEDRLCKCDHYESSHQPGGCQEKTDKSCHAWECECDVFEVDHVSQDEKNLNKAPKCPIHKNTELSKCSSNNIGYCADCKEVYKIKAEKQDAFGRKHDG